MVRRVIVGLLRGHDVREGAVGTLMEMSKDLIRRGHVGLGKSIVRSVWQVCVYIYTYTYTYIHIHIHIYIYL